jgi:hypothetical protein
MGLMKEIPHEWYGSADDELDHLLSRLLERRSLVPDLILSFKNSSRNPFPSWGLPKRGRKPSALI